MSRLPFLPADAFTRRAGRVDPETGVTAPRGRSRVKVRTEHRQYGPSDPEWQRVRAYRRSYPGGPPRPRDVRVRCYLRHRPLRAWLSADERAHAREWTAYLARYYGITAAAARRMERETPP